MGTYLEIQTRVQRIVIDLPAAVQAEVPTLINEAMVEVQIEHNFKVMEALVSAQLTVAATRTLMALPERFKEFRKQPFLVTDTGATKHLEATTDRDYILSTFHLDEEGSPIALLISEPTNELGEANIELWPLPDGNSDFSDGEYRVYIPYWRFLTPLANDGDQNWITVKGEEYLIERAASRAFALDWDNEKEAVHLQKANIAKQRLIKLDKLYRVSTTTTLVPYYEGANSPKIRR